MKVAICRTCIVTITIFKIHVRRAAGRGYSYFHLWMCFLVCTGPPGLTKNDTDLKLGNKQPKITSKNVFFFVFSKNWQWEPLPSKNCRVSLIFRVSPRLPCLLYIQKSLKLKITEFSVNLILRIILIDLIVFACRKQGHRTNWFFGIFSIAFLRHLRLVYPKSDFNFEIKREATKKLFFRKKFACLILEGLPI